MKKLHLILIFIIISIVAYILTVLLSSAIDPLILNMVRLFGHIFGFCGWALVFWSLGSVFQVITGNPENEFPGITIEKIKLHVEELGFDVYGRLLSSEKFNESTPLVFLLTGGGGRHENFLGMGATMVNFGFKAFLFDHPGVVGRSHGTTPESKIRSPTKSILTLKKMIDYAISREDIDTDKIGLFGASLGAFTVVYGGFTDERVKVIIGQSVGLIEGQGDMQNVKKNMQWWFKKFCQYIKLDIDDLANLNYDQFKDSKFEHLRDRVYLLQTRDDKAVHHESFLKLKETLKLPDTNCLVFEKGGHGFLHHQQTILGWVLGKLNNHLFNN